MFSFNSLELSLFPVDDENVSNDNNPNIIPSDALKLLICMNNCNYTLKEVLPKIKSLYQSMFENVSMDEPYEGAASSYDILRQKLLETYIDMKIESIVDPIEPNMYSGKFDWARCPKPRDAKDYVKGRHLLFLCTNSRLFFNALPAYWIDHTLRKTLRFLPGSGVTT